MPWELGPVDKVQPGSPLPQEAPCTPALLPIQLDSLFLVV